jgi:hypothetical protein
MYLEGGLVDGVIALSQTRAHVGVMAQIGHHAMPVHYGGELDVLALTMPAVVCQSPKSGEVVTKGAF